MTTPTSSTTLEAQGFVNIVTPKVDPLCAVYLSKVKDLENKLSSREAILNGTINAKEAGTTPKGLTAMTMPLMPTSVNREFQQKFNEISRRAISEATQLIIDQRKEDIRQLTEAKESARLEYSTHYLHTTKRFCEELKISEAATTEIEQLITVKLKQNLDNITREVLVKRATDKIKKEIGQSNQALATAQDIVPDEVDPIEDLRKKVLGLEKQIKVQKKQPGSTNQPSKPTKSTKPAKGNSTPKQPKSNNRAPKSTDKGKPKPKGKGKNKSNKSGKGRGTAQGTE